MEPIDSDPQPQNLSPSDRLARRRFRPLRALVMLLGGVVLVLGGLVAFLAAAAWTPTGTRAAGARLERMEASPRYHEGRFHNDLPRQEPPFWPIARRWFMEEGDAVREPKVPPAVLTRTADEFRTPPRDGLRVTWLGHSSMLIEIDGMKVLTDPVWGERASPFSFYGPKRFFPPPMALDQLPKLDLVVISHDHYDHLDEPTIVELNRREVSFAVPLGVGAHLEYWGVAPEKIIELDWWQETQVGSLRVVATPSRHFSGRSIGDRDATLWASWTLLGPEHRAFFSGDTAMFPGFEEIGRRFGPFDVTMIEVGAYNAMWADVHLGPEQAVLAHQALQGKLMLPVHWGTFNLAFHSWTEPVERLLIAADAREVTVAIPRPGQSVEPGSIPQTNPAAEGSAQARSEQAPQALTERWWPVLAWETADQHPIISSGLADGRHAALPDVSGCLSCAPRDDLEGGFVLPR